MVKISSLLLGCAIEERVYFLASGWSKPTLVMAIARDIAMSSVVTQVPSHKCRLPGSVVGLCWLQGDRTQVHPWKEGPTPLNAKVGQCLRKGKPVTPPKSPVASSANLKIYSDSKIHWILGKMSDDKRKIGMNQRMISLAKANPDPSYSFGL
jgi:hypothetical protein